MSAAPNLTLVPEDDPMEALRAEAKRLRDALKDSERQREFIENTLLNMTHHIVKLHEQFATRQDGLQRQVNAVALAASLVPSLEQRLSFVESRTPV